MKLHPLSPEEKCPMCGGVLVYVRMRRFGDLYQCAHGARACQGAVLHYRKAGTDTCGWARVLETAFPDKWTECLRQAAEER